MGAPLVLQVLQVLQVLLVAAALGCLGSCSNREASGTGRLPEQSELKVATDVFWALDKMGYAVSKEKPLRSRHGCTPSEYLAKKGTALFRISVFHCGDADQARNLVENPKTRRVDELLRNHGEGGILQRGPMEIIVRMTAGEKKDASELMNALGAL